jgi:phosphopantothenoylcysteine decarboxylase / phosphopantothenate---cysteine ligase
VIRNKHILLGVTGSIAAYKSAFLIRLLVQAGADVRVVMTPSAHDFIAPLTLATLSKHQVYSEFTEDKDKGTWSNHVELGLWADLFLIAPVTANTISAMAQGQANNFLLATFLSARCPVMVAPAMDLDMYTHASTQENLKILHSRSTLILEPREGELASGLTGKGRMEEPEEIVEAVEAFFLKTAPLAGKKALVSAGPTFEPIDAVRFIGNYSSGKMGYAIAEELANQGAEVTLVSGPSSLVMEHSGVHTVSVQTAAQMMQACVSVFPEADIAVMAAAVADYRPAEVQSNKIKKKVAELTLKLEPTQDILAHLGTQKTDRQVLVGFALETDNEESNAREKLSSKNLDMIVLNSLNDDGAGFGHDTNKVKFIESSNKMASFELKSKTEVAKDIVKKIIELCK